MSTSTKPTAKFPYPDNKPPVYKKLSKLDGGVHTENLTNVYKTTRDVATELHRELQVYLDKARARVCGLVEEVNRLKQTIRDLKAELKQVRDELAQTKETLEKANSTALHPALQLMDGDPAEWSKKDENMLAF